MAKAFWIAFYEAPPDSEALAQYGKAARPAIEAGGGRFLARGMPSKVFESGKKERTVVIEFDSVGKAVATYESPAYQNAEKMLQGKAVRQIRIIEGVG